MNLAKKAEEDKKKVKVTIWGENAEPMKGHKYNVEIGTIKRDGTTNSEGIAEEKIEDDKIEKITKAVSPMLLPMITALSELEE